MPRNKAIMKYPTLNDKKGDLSKKWYVEYYYRVPDDDNPRKRRIYEGLCNGTAEQRYKNATKIINKVTNILQNPKLLYEIEYKGKILMDDYATHEEAKRYNQRQKEIAISNTTSKYIEYLKGSISQKTYETYKSKLHYFALWVESNNVGYLSIKQTEIVPFFQWVASERKLTKRSVGKYIQIVRSFYSWLIQQEYCQNNPVYNIPNYGVLKDCAPSVISHNDIERLRDAIKSNDPYLWLACEIQYYCALRPGQEIRLLRIRDIDIEHKTITVRQENAKNKCKETISMNDDLCALIIKMGIMNYNKDLFVFGSYNIPSKKPMGKNTLRNRFNRFRDDLGIDKSVKFYSWKHTGAVSAVANGVSVWELQHHLRHSSITTTEEYIRQRASQARKAKDYIDKI